MPGCGLDDAGLVVLDDPVSRCRFAGGPVCVVAGCAGGAVEVVLASACDSVWLIADDEEALVSGGTGRLGFSGMRFRPALGSDGMPYIFFCF